MAVQYHIAYSSEVMGSGTFAGGPFYCAQGQLSNAFTQCMYGIMLDVNKLITITKNLPDKNIDNIVNLTNSRVFLYSGSRDSTVYPVVMHGLETYFKAFIDPKNIKTNFNTQSEHCQPTDSYGNSCTYKGTPYINNCNYDGAGAALQTIYPTLKARGTANSNNIVSFDQSSYMPNGATPGSASMADQGFAYIPTACQSSNGKNNTCKLLFSFHGCQQTTADIGNDWYTDTGLNDWAESNNIVVIYPQVVKSYLLPSNPEGCWDWWGYTDSNYSVKSGIQIGFVSNMIDKL